MSAYEDWAEAEEAPWEKVNEAHDILGQAFLWAQRPAAHAGLTVGYGGGVFDGNDVADGTVTGLSDNTTNYLVVHRTTRAVTSSTATTNWDDTATYGHMARAIFASGVLTWKDERRSPGGIFDRSAAAGAVDADDVTYTPTTPADWDGGADPGDVAPALDQLAERVTDLEAVGVGVGGSTGSTDNVLLRADGSGGATLQATGVTVSDADEIHGYLAKQNLQTGTTYTIDVAGADTDSGKIIDLANAAAIAVTLPNSAPAGFACTCVQAGAGQVTFTVAGGGSAVLRNRQGHTKTAGQWAMVMLEVRSNAGGTAAEWVLGGDTAS